MLNTLHLAPALTLGLTPIYETFPTSHQCFFVAVYFNLDPSALPVLLSRTFSPFWPRVAAEATFGQVGPPCVFLPPWHATLHFTLVLTHAQRRRARSPCV